MKKSFKSDSESDDDETFKQTNGSRRGLVLSDDSDEEDTKNVNLLKKPEPHKLSDSEEEEEKPKNKKKESKKRPVFSDDSDEEPNIEKKSNVKNIMDDLSDDSDFEKKTKNNKNQKQKITISDDSDEDFAPKKNNALKSSFKSSDDSFNGMKTNPKKPVPSKKPKINISDSDDSSKSMKANKPGKNQVHLSDDSDDDFAPKKNNPTRGIDLSEDSDDDITSEKKTKKTNNRLVLSNDSEESDNDKKPIPKQKPKKQIFNSDSSDFDFKPPKGKIKKVESEDESEDEKPLKGKKKNRFGDSSSEEDDDPPKKNIMNKNKKIQLSDSSDDEMPINKQTLGNSGPSDLDQKFKKNKTLRMAKKKRYDQEVERLKQDSIFATHENMKKVFSEMNREKTRDRANLENLKQTANQEFELRRAEMMRNADPNSVQLNQQLQNIKNEVFAEANNLLVQLRNKEKNNLDTLQNHEIELRKRFNRKKEGIEELLATGGNTKEDLVVIEKIEVSLEEKGFTIDRNYGEMIMDVKKEGFDVIEGGINRQAIIATPTERFFKKKRVLEVWGKNYDVQPKLGWDELFEASNRIQLLIDEWENNIAQYMSVNFLS